MMIRFGLSQLAAQNKHHDFETLCRHFARKRICSNILPATGPVSSGGDQGRDFETFRTYLVKQSGTTAFLGSTTEKTIVFTCTLQQTSLGVKIKSDILSVVSQGTHVDDVYAFCEANIPVGERHRIIDDALKNFGVRLEVFDGNALAELLEDAELFWLAQSFLDIPSEVTPDLPRDAGELWYREDLITWQSAEQPVLTFGNFADLKRCLRYTTLHPQLIGDLPFWLERMSVFEEDGLPSSLQRRASYEIIVASLRGLNTLDEQEDRIATYFSDIALLVDNGAVEDAQVLIAYLAAAHFRRLCRIGATTIMGWRESLIHRVEDLLEAEPTAGRRSSLLQTLGALHLVPDAANPADPLKTEHVDAALRAWSDILDVAPEAPLFPIDRFGNLVSVAAVFLAASPVYRPFARRLDELVAGRNGRAAAAQKCRDRAVQFYRGKHYTAALREFHFARIDWLSGDTVRGSLLSSAMIARCYDELHLHMAAKYFWLSCGIMALHPELPELRDLGGTALLSAAQSDYIQGSWFGFLELAEAGLLVHQTYDPNAMDFNKHAILKSTVLSLAMSNEVARRLCSGVQDAVGATLDATGTRHDIHFLETTARSPWADVSDAEVGRRVEEELGASAFADSGAERDLRWRALGVVWTVTFLNAYDTVRAAERFVAIAQILLADLAGTDLCLVPSSVAILFALNLDAATVEDEPSNDGRRWLVGLSRHDATGEEAVRQTQIEAFAAILTILRDISVLPVVELDQRVERTVADGILSKITPSSVYDVLYGKAVPADRFLRSQRDTCIPFRSGDDVDPPEHPLLGWSSGPGPGYSSASAKEFLANRYASFAMRTQRTRDRLARDDQFVALVGRLREKGWLDWQILSAVFHVAHGYRLNLGNGMRSFKGLERRSRRWFGPEQEDWPVVPITEFSETELYKMRDVSLPATLQVWGLECRQYTPDYTAILRFLIGHTVTPSTTSLIQTHLASMPPLLVLWRRLELLADEFGEK